MEIELAGFDRESRN